MKIGELIKIGLEACKKHSPEMLTGLGISGFIITTVMAVKATPKAMKKIEDKKKELGKEKLSIKETVATAWTCYIPSAILAAGSTTAVIGSTTKLLKTNTVLATTLAISETARKEFEEKAKEIVGEKKVNEIKEEVAKEDMKKSYVSSGGTMISSVIGNGSVLCWMKCTNQWFMGDHETVRQKVNNLNFRMANGNEPYITIDELCDEFMLPHVPLGGRLRWDANKRLLDPRYYTDWAPDGRPCMVIDFDEDDYLNVR